MKNEFKYQGRLFLADTLNYLWFAITGRWLSRWMLKRVLGLSERQISILQERYKMKQNGYKLWFEILTRDNWTCQNVKCGIMNYRNQDPFKPKMQVDHIGREIRLDIMLSMDGLKIV